MITGKPIPGYPGIHIVDKAEGRRAMLVGTRLRVSDIARSVEHDGGSPAEVASWLELEQPLVEMAMRYYRDHPDQVEAWIREEDDYNERAEAEWRREHGIGSRR